MSDRFFADSPISGENAELHGPEAHHAIHVMRLEVGDSVTLFDGSGAEFDARVERIERRSVQLSIHERHPINRELPFQLSLAVSLPKGDRQRWLVEKATELGVSRIIPLTTERSVVRVSSSAIKKLERTVVEASKQCGRNVLMRIEEPESWSSLVARCDQPEQRWIAHPMSANESLFEACRSRSAAENLLVAIGPEGGFDEAELAVARESDWRSISLGPRILRIETAAIAVAAAVVASE